MALKTLKDGEDIGGFIIEEIPCIEPAHGGTFVKICHGSNTISFRIQTGPIKENGVNGCQVDTIIEAAKTMIERLNIEFPCRENSIAITKLDDALMWLKKRKEDREKRGVEGTNQK